jgi:ABC-type glutathione transport system ATPase component
MTLLSVEGLTVALPSGLDRPHAVEDVSFTLDAGEILCIVGESGSGKSCCHPRCQYVLGRSCSKARTFSRCRLNPCAGCGADGWA